MKKLTLLATLCMAFLCSCEIQDGVYSYRDIYILVGDVPVDAQNYVLTIPSDAGEYDVPFLTWGGLRVRVLKECSGIEVSAENDNDCVYQWGYKNYMHISAEANTGKKARKLKLALFSDAYNGFRADITILQEGR